MTKMLDVYFYEKRIGELIQDNNGEMQFAYLPRWLEDPKAVAISFSLPLQKKAFNRKECRPFFSGILPEENQRKIIAKNLGISANNDFSLLQRIGGECAGAITFLSSDENLQTQKNSYHLLTEATLAKVLRELPYRPLLAGEQDIRLSLAGVQDKIAVCVQGGKISIPLFNAPSTHILKPAIDTYEGLIFNEAFCLALAKKIGLTSVNVEIKKVEDIDYLLIERYDRKILNTNKDNFNVQRYHQEDFCQALSIVPENKYQNEGGPSLKQCFNLLREVSTVPVSDIGHLIDVIIFNVLIGNCDAHGKNFSLLYTDQIRLAPSYDLVSTLYYPELSPHMAMKLGGEYKINKISLKNFEQFAEEIGLAKKGICTRVSEIIELIRTALSAMDKVNTTEEGVCKLILKRCGL